MSFVDLHSPKVALQIEDAVTLPQLQAGAQRADELVALLHGEGISIERLTRLVSELHTRLLQRLWTLLAPAEVVANSCLLAMGSEGRGEQILKTDQDNALLLRDGFDFAGQQALAERFNASLVQMGWPPCPGQIMMSNPLWRQTVSNFKASLRGWIFGPADDGPMHLAIFFDASVVAGDASLLASASAELVSLVAGNDLFLLRFAAAADQFHPPGGWFSRVTSPHREAPLDLKKLGIFPVVHGVRALALQHGVRAPSTAQRLRALVEVGRLQAPLARELLEALHLLMGLRLTHQLRQREVGLAASNEVHTAALSTPERESLRDALAIVKGFRAFLRSHFHFE